MHFVDRYGHAVTSRADRHRLISTRDLTAAGLSHRQISAAARSGALERVVRGLYRLPGSRTKTQDIAASLRRHERAAASHRSAGYLHGLTATVPDRPDIWLPVGSTSRSKIATVHRSPLESSELTTGRGLPVTSAARTVVDLAEYLSADELSDIVGAAIARRLVRIADVARALECVEAAPGRHGSGRVRSVLDAWGGAIEPESPAEAVVLRRIRSAGLPMPATQFELMDEEGSFVARLDLAWPDRRVAREYDSDTFHGAHRADDDERRRQRIEACGWTVDVIHRGHLVPSRSDWLAALARDLGHRQTVAS